MLSKEELINLVSTDVDAFNTEIRNVKGGIDLSETDFSNIELEGAEFFNVDLTSSSFADSHLTEVKFDACDLTSVDFTRANVVECSFSESVLNGTDLSACRFDEETVWPDNEYLPEDFDSKYSSDLSSLQDEDDYQQSDY